MENLVFVHSWGDEGCCGTSHIPFLYKSKDDFVFDILERYKDIEWLSDWHEVEIKELNIYINRYDLESIEHQVYTLSGWFEAYKVN